MSKVKLELQKIVTRLAKDLAANAKADDPPHGRRMLLDNAVAELAQREARAATAARLDEMGRYGQWLIAHAKVPDAKTLMQYKIERTAALNTKPVEQGDVS